MAYYETVVLARREMSSSQFESLISTLQNLLVERGAKISRVENWGLRSLAYKIRKSSKAYYCLLNFEAPREAVQEFTQRLKLMEDVVRELTIATEDLPSEPSVMMVEQQTNNNRERR